MAKPFFHFVFLLLLHTHISMWHWHESCTLLIGWYTHIPIASQVIVNYSSSSGPAEEVAHIIEESGGEAITIGADISKPAEVDRSELAPLACLKYLT